VTIEAKKRSPLRTALILTLIVLVPIIPFAILGELPGESWLDEQQGSLAIGSLGAGLLAADVFLPIPSTVVGSLLGLRLGFVLGALWAWSGLFTGNLLGYLAGRLALRKAGLELPAWHTGLALFVTRPIPILAEAVAIAAGAGRVPIATFVVASLTGNAVFAIVLAASGTALVSEHWAGIGLAAPMALPALGWWLLRVMRKRSANEPG
jgi:uncharacterized membrane protein YdjX (TVP38/TMEM64 family)